jgi:threonine/homoserine/homoserine lactone efflux protein|tara:strand:+ start:1424 stop:2092 length:669 start_codon:yes stop_codon:yes gene_type:complete
LNVLIAFLLATVLSAYGSLMLGLVNASVIETALTKNRKAALWLAFGGVLPEIPYVLIAIWGVSYADVLQGYKSIITVAVGLVFIFIGIRYVFIKNKIAPIKEFKSDRGGHNYLYKGFLLALANPQLIFYWLTWLLLIQTGMVTDLTDGLISLDFTGTYFYSTRIAFALGAVFGAFLVLWIYVKLASRYKAKLIHIMGNKLTVIVGLVFMILGVLAIVKIFFK